jgi:Tol biopolymer transport system component
MSELKERLRPLELIQAPDLRDRIREWEPRAPRSQPLFKRLGVVALAFVVAGAGIAFAVQAFRATEPRTQPAATIENGRIAFSVGPDADIFVIEPDGTGLTKMIDRHVSGQEGGLQMTWSHDGTKLAFTDYRPNGSTGLFVMDAEGGAVDISPSLQLADSPTWSPDGSELAFGGCCDDYYDIYVVNADGTDLRRLTNERDNGVDGAHSPAWSPDGSKIAYSVDRYNENSQDETHGISIVNAAGGDPDFITWSVNIDESPVWSPDATRIAFLRKAPDGYVDVFVVSAVGDPNEPTRLSSPSVHATSLPNWAPDSEEVLFSARRLDNDNQGVYVVSVDGTDEHVLLEDAIAGDPVWSPDGRWIAFVRDDAGSGFFAIWLMQRDGTGLSELASGFEEAGGLDWQSLSVPDEGTDAPEPSTTPASSSFPLTYPEGENEVMPIAFLNGSTAEMVYPADLPLEQVTIQPNGSLYVGVLDFRLDGLTSNFVVQRSPAEGLEPIQSYDPPQDGIVRRWQAVPAVGQAVRLGPWLVDVPYETLTDEQRQAFLDHLFGLETEGGFLILGATPPLRLWPIGDGEELVTQMYFDDSDIQILDRCIDFSQAADDSFVRNGIEVFRAVEGAAVGVDVWFWCDPTGEFGIQVNEGPVADALVDGLSFRNVQR